VFLSLHFLATYYSFSEHYLEKSLFLVLLCILESWLLSRGLDEADMFLFM